MNRRLWDADGREWAQVTDAGFHATRARSAELVASGAITLALDDNFHLTELAPAAARTLVDVVCEPDGLVFGGVAVTEWADGSGGALVVFETVH